MWLLVSPSIRKVSLSAFVVNTMMRSMHTGQTAHPRIKQEEEEEETEEEERENKANKQKTPKTRFFSPANLIYGFNAVSFVFYEELHHFTRGRRITRT